MDWIQFIGLLLAMYGMHRETQKEQKEFHGRLCALEEKYKNNIEEMIKKILERK